MLFHLYVIIVLYHFNVYVCNVIITLISLRDDRCLNLHRRQLVEIVDNLQWHSQT